jgi:hypothetical protein
MKTTIVLALLLAATPAFAQSSGGPGAPGATMHDYRLGPHQRTRAGSRPLRMQVPRNAHASGTHTAVRTGTAINRQKIRQRLHGYPSH